MKEIEIVVARNEEEARDFMNQGYCPVECSFGEVSIVDELRMDHHGKLSELAPVSIRAYEKHYGARSKDPRFVVAGGPDADACFAIVALAGTIVENPDEEPPECSEWDPNDGFKAELLGDWKRAVAKTKDLYQLVAARDRNPHINMIEESSVYGRKYGFNVILLWFLQQRFRSWDEAIKGLSIAFSKWTYESSFFADCFDQEIDRREQAEADMLRGTTLLVPSTSLSILLVAPQGGFGFDVFYQHHDFVVQYNKEIGSITVGARDLATAKLLGPEGLLYTFKKLSEGHKGWGGSPTVGGSPRGQKMEFSEAIGVAFHIGCTLSSRATYDMVEPHLHL